MFNIPVIKHFMERPHFGSIKNKCFHCSEADVMKSSAFVAVENSCYAAFMAAVALIYIIKILSVVATKVIKIHLFS